jgi:hypothetical protein
LTPDPSPEATGYASWDETLTLKETIEALEATLDDLNQQDTHIAYRLSSIIDEFRRGIGRLNARCDRIEAALAASGRPLPPETKQTKLLANFDGFEEGEQ